MSRTIVQAFGPIYGEPVNGTVQGRPNGSVYVPLTNKISLSVTKEYIKVTSFDWGDYYNLCDDQGVVDWGGTAFTAVALAQDLSSNIKICLYSDEALTNLIGYRTGTNGIFNISNRELNATDILTPQVGDTLYLVAILENNSTPVATSNVEPLELVA